MAKPLTSARSATRVASSSAVPRLEPKSTTSGVLCPGRVRARGAAVLVLEVRREIERLLSRAGAERANNDQREQLLEIARGMDRAAKTNDDISFMRLDRELNRLVIEAAHNDYAARSMKLLQGLSRRFWYMHYREAADLPLCARLHANQARAIARGNGEAAARASDKLMDYVENFTRGTVSV